MRSPTVPTAPAVNCHQPIPPERLNAVPEAVRCLNCQRLFEGLHRQHTHHV